MYFQAERMRYSEILHPWNHRRWSTRAFLKKNVCYPVFQRSWDDKEISILIFLILYNLLLNWSILLMTALCKKVFDAVAFIIVKKNLTSSSPIALKDKQTLFIPWIRNSRYLWKTRITSSFVFPTCSINQICLCIETGIGSVEIDFTADFSVHLPHKL